MESLAKANAIPSRSWGYTAGASYRTPALVLWLTFDRS